MSKPSNPADGKYVVIENGQRVTAPTDNAQQAAEEALRRNKLAEGRGQAVPESKRATVQQNLFG